MHLLQTVAQNLPPLALELDPQLLLTLLVVLLFLILVVIGVFAAWSRTRRLKRRGQEREDSEWKEELMRGIAEPPDNDRNSR